MFYIYEYINKHVVIDINNERWLLDTGSPSTFRFDNSFADLIIDGTNYRMKTNPGYNINAIHNLVGENVTGMIGDDVLSKTSFILYGDYKMEFCTNPKYMDNPIDFVKHPLYSYAIIIKFELDGKMIKALVDTGAYINYSTPEYINDKFVGVVTDYDRNNKLITNNLYNHDVRFNNKLFNLDFAIPKDLNSFPMQAMHALNVQAIIGLNDFMFQFGYISFDYKNNKIYSKW